MASKILPYDKFLEHMENAPWPVVDLLVLGQKGVCLTFRKASGRDKSYENMWHLPGGFLLKGEFVTDCVIRIAKKELGVDISGIPLLRYRHCLNNPKEVRGHLVHVVVAIDLRGKELAVGFKETVDSVFFPIDSTALPEVTIPHHMIILNSLIAVMNTRADLGSLIHRVSDCELL